VCSADSKTVLYTDADSKLDKVSIEGGASQQFPDYVNFGRITISPDEKLAAIITSHPLVSKMTEARLRAGADPVS
jgi:hypothetical protein